MTKRDYFAMAMKEEGFNYYKYNYCILINMDNTFARITRYPNKRRDLSDIREQVERTYCIFNSKKTKLLEWGSLAYIEKYQFLDNGEFHIDGLLQKILCVYQVNEDKRTENDAFILKAASLFLNKFVRKHTREQNLRVPIEKCHFAFVIPSEWDIGIREALLRPLFIQATLITKRDHPNRLLFFTKLESALQNLHVAADEGRVEKIRYGKRYTMCDLERAGKDIVIRLDSFDTKYSPSNVKGSVLVPKILSSASIIVTDIDTIEMRLKECCTRLVKEKFGKDDPAISNYLHDSFMLRLGKNDEKIDDIDFLSGPSDQVNENLKSINQTIALLKEAFISMWRTEMLKKMKIVFSNSTEQIPTFVVIQGSFLYNQHYTDFDLIYSPPTPSPPPTPLSMEDKVFGYEEPFYVKSAGDLQSNQSQEKEEEKEKDFQNEQKVVVDKDIDNKTYKIVANTKEDTGGLNYKTESLCFSWIIQLLKEHSALQNYRLMEITHKKPGLMQTENKDITLGAAYKLMEKMQTSDTITPVNFINHKKETSEQVLATSKLAMVVNIDLTMQATNISCSVLDGNNEFVEQIADMDGVFSGILGNITPLGSLLKSEGSNCYIQLSTTRNKEWIKGFMDYHFGAALEYFSNFDRHVVHSDDQESLVRSKQMMTASQNGTLFKLKNKRILPAVKRLFYPIDTSSIGNKIAVVTIHEPKYIKVILAMYLGYLECIVNDQLSIHFGKEIMDRNIYYLVSIEKLLLDRYIGTMNSFKDLVYATGLFEKESDDTNKKVHIITQGESILPTLQQQFDLDLPVKSYYVQALLHPKYIQLTLYQVVVGNDDTTGADASSINIKDTCIAIDDMYESLSKYLLLNIQCSEELFKCCTKHRHDCDPSLSVFCSLVHYKNLAKELKHFIKENFVSDHDMLPASLDKKHKITSNSSCDCSILLSKRDIINVGFKEFIRDAATIIAGSLSNKDLFRKFMVKQLLVIGRFLVPQYSSALDNILAMQLERILSVSTTNKEIELKCIVEPGTIDYITQPKMGKKAPFLDTITKGTPYQVSSENFGLKFSIDSADNSHNHQSVEVLCKIYDQDDEKNPATLVQRGGAFVILRKGQLLSREGISIKIHVQWPDISSSTDFLNIYFIRYSERVWSEYLMTTYLEDWSYNILTKFNFSRKYVDHKLPLLFKLEPSNESSSLNITARPLAVTSSSPLANDQPQCAHFGEPLTVSYL